MDWYVQSGYESLDILLMHNLDCQMVANPGRLLREQNHGGNS